MQVGHVSGCTWVEDALAVGRLRRPSPYPFEIHSLKLTAIAPENGWLEDYMLFQKPYFQGRTVSFREANFLLTRTCQFLWCKSELCFLVAGSSSSSSKGPCCRVMSVQDESRINHDAVDLEKSHGNLRVPFQCHPPPTNKYLTRPWKGQWLAGYFLRVAVSSVKYPRVDMKQ